MDENRTTILSIEQTHRMLKLLGLPVDTTDADLVMTRFEEIASRALPMET